MTSVKALMVAARAAEAVAAIPIIKMGH